MNMATLQVWSPARSTRFLTLALTGDLPQNINFAIRGSRLYGFLHANGITPLAADTSVILSAPDIAERASGLSVAVRCHTE